MCVEYRQFLAAANERGLGQCLAAIMQPNHESRFGLPLLQRLRNHRQVRDHGFRRLVAVAGILPQQSLDDFVQHARHRQTEAPQFGRLHRHVLSQDLADALALKWRPAGEALKEHDSRRVQVGTLGHFLVEQPRPLGRQVLRGSDPLVPDAGVQFGAAGQSEIDERGFTQGSAFIHDHIGGLDIAMQHFAGMRCAQCGQERTAQRDRVQHGKRTLPQTRLKCDSRNEGHDQINLIPLGARIEQGREQTIPDLRKDAGFMFEPHPRRGRERCRRRRLDDYGGRV